jgi:hypothetical protein
LNQTKFNRLIDYAYPLSFDITREKKHVSLIVRRGSVVSSGTNEYKTHPLAAKIGYRFEEMHSELSALTSYNGPKNGLSLINFRFNNQGDLKMAKPCCLCIPWCEWVFDKIYYSTTNGIVLHKYKMGEIPPITEYL